jgi:hypothetical protein
MKIKHPRAGDGPGVPPARVDVNGESRVVDDDGTFEADGEAWLRRFAARHDVDPGDILVEDGPPPDNEAGTCDAVKSDGEVCGRDLPCPYHTGSED